MWLETYCFSVYLCYYYYYYSTILLRKHSPVANIHPIFKFFSETL